MSKAIYALGALPALLFGVCAAATAAEPPAKPAVNELRVTPFVAGKAESKARKATAPKTEKEAIAGKRKLASGITVMQLPADRMNHLVRVELPDGTVRIMHEGDTPVATPKSEVK